MRDWSTVPQELLQAIAECLKSIADYVRFGGVCQSWRSATVDQRGYCFSPKTLPWLMFPRQKDSNEYDGSGKPNFFSLSEDKFYNINMPENTISTRKLFSDCYLSGSPYGWLITFSGTKVDIFNPLSRDYLPLPSLSTCENYSPSLLIKKAVLALSSSHSAMKPAEDRFVVLLSLASARNEKFAFSFAKPRDKAWTTVKIPSIVEDIINFNNQFYVVDRKGVVWQFDITSPTPSAAEFVLPPVGVGYDFTSYYLVELSGELHMVVKLAFTRQSPLSPHLCHFEPGSRPFVDSQMVYFSVFQLDFRRAEWKQVFTLADYAIFVGRSVSISLPVQNYPNCKGSSIYFADDWLGDMLHIGVYNLETTGLKTLFTGNDVPSLYAAPVWFIPNLC